MLTFSGLVRYAVFFVMKVKTRTVKIAGITCEPDEAWMAQIARSLTDARDGFLRGVQHVILDRDPLYTAAFRRLLQDRGVTPLLLPPRSPNLNAFAERLCYPPKPRAWTASCHSAKRTSGRQYARLCITILRNARTKVWATSSCTQDSVDGHGPGEVP